MKLPRLHVPVAAWSILLAWLAMWVLMWPPAAAAADAQDDMSAASRALQKAQAAVVGVQSIAVDGARSAATLGRVREGSGVVISREGLVLTIGYLVLEAEQVQIVTDDARTIPARFIGYDVATGFGLLQALAPLRIDAVPLGRSGALNPREGLMIASGGEDGAVSAAWLVSRRAFSGYWEYHIPGALFTTPPRRDHSGAGLFNIAGELVGIGSLIVADAAGGDERLPGNMFVPIDLLSPIFDELLRVGSSTSSKRAWIGINCVEHDGAVRIVRINDDSPADVAGLQAGDKIVRIDGADVHALEELWTRLWSGGEPEREVVLDIQRNGEAQTVRVFSVDRMKTLKRARGI
ncbi:serine protease [Aquincola sp. S2]|uniref:Serine protease n=1 Tax=Pseudaquabacterium terrae TaxID=2732868 RepID=A0ABX2EHF0_9BURK|nr:S1C family serine protease [Aquabacterium terrae]NRF68058.1 serine protease [Aquabacterium terrae]